MAFLTLTCPSCGHEEYPLRHYFESRCGGRVVRGWGGLKCEDCGMRIYKFQCDRCRRRLDGDDVS